MAETYKKIPIAHDLQLAGNEYHLWHIPHSSDYVNKLRGPERDRYHRMSHPETRADYAASQAGLREVLARYVQCHPDEVRLLRRECGKPYLSSGPEFNLSHSAGQVLLAVAGQPVGLDVESASRAVRFAGLAAKFFTHTERDRVASSPAEIQNLWFLRHWVCKEATVKLSGDGIFRGLREAEVVFEAEGSGAGRYRERPVFLQEFQPVPGYLAALASWEPLRLGRRFSL